MAKKEPLEPSVPSKAYLVSFGDTMTALLAFFIVLNSLASEQTGANLYSGTGSFVSAFGGTGMPGTLPTDRSSDVIRQNSPKPIYALSDNLDKNEGSVGPDDTDKKDDIKDRDAEQFQKFLTAIQKDFGLSVEDQVTDQTVFDSFESFDKETGNVSRHAIQLLSDGIAKMRDPSVKLEIIVWANVPSQSGLERSLEKTKAAQAELTKRFWVKTEDMKRIRFRAKPWLFADAKRPVLSLVVSKTSPK